MARPIASFAAIATIATLGLLAVNARAQDAPQPQPPEPSHAQLHDGFYLRMGIGGGSLASHDHVDGATDGNPTVTGGGAAAEVSIGGAPEPGYVLACTVLAQSTDLGNVSDGAGTRTLSKSLDFAMLGATLDYFPDPRGGFHVMGTLGPAFMSAIEDDQVHRRWRNDVGPGISLATGYDWWIAPRWSLGFLVRATGARLYGTTIYDDATRTTSDAPASQRNVGLFSVSFTGLFH